MLHILVTGGTFDKEYNELNTQLETKNKEIKKSFLKAFIKLNFSQWSDYTLKFIDV